MALKNLFIKKINKLLIPFLFFYIFTSLLPSIILHKSTLFSEFYFFIKYGPNYNYPIWFLLCLFETNLLFYVVFIFSELVSKNHSNILALIITVLFGLIGIILSVYNISFPLYLDTACTVLPFFSFGWWLGHNTGFLQCPFVIKHDIPILLVCIIVVCVFAAPVDYSTNTFSPKATYTAYICGIAGTLFVLTVAKYIKYIAIISFWGRYSIMILCSHMLFIIIVSMIIAPFNFPPILSFLITFALTMLCCHFTIPFMKRCLPYVTAQKDVIKTNYSTR